MRWEIHDATLPRVQRGRSGHWVPHSGATVSHAASHSKFGAKDYSDGSAVYNGLAPWYDHESVNHIAKGHGPHQRRRGELLGDDEGIHPA